MEYRTLGRTGVKVSQLCLGAMNFGEAYTGNRYEVSAEIIHRALDAGINFIDTADVYSRGESEEQVGKAIRDRRENIVLATKANGVMGDDPNQSGNSRRWITRAVEDSLRRLDTDYIDLYQMHRPDPSCDVTETLGVLSDLVHAGKVRYIGCSNFPAHLIVEAHWAAEANGFVHFMCEQPPYSILNRGIEADVLPTAQKYGMGVIPWSPLSRGILSGRHRKGTDPGPSHRDAMMAKFGRAPAPGPEAAKRAIAKELAELADAHGLTMIDMSLAFVLNHPAVTSAIIGPRTMEHLESQLNAPSVTLSDELLNAIDTLVAPGTRISDADIGWATPSLDKANLRR